MIQVAGRLKDALWSLRMRFGMEADIDRVFPFVISDQKLDREQLENLFIAYPKLVPEDFKSALVARIRQIIRQYWAFRNTRKGFHKIIRNILFLEEVARFGFDGCRLVHNQSTGYQLVLKSGKYGSD